LFNSAVVLTGKPAPESTTFIDTCSACANSTGADVRRTVPVSTIWPPSFVRSPPSIVTVYFLSTLSTFTEFAGTLGRS
jgi:hypothetical protein